MGFGGCNAIVKRPREVGRRTVAHHTLKPLATPSCKLVCATPLTLVFSRFPYLYPFTSSLLYSLFSCHLRLSTNVFSLFVFLLLSILYVYFTLPSFFLFYTYRWSPSRAFYQQNVPARLLTKLRDFRTPEFQSLSSVFNINPNQHFKQLQSSIILQVKIYPILLIYYFLINFLLRH